MTEKAVFLLVVEGFADWEPAHAVAELRRHGQYRVESVGLSRTSIQSMGGIRIVPSTTVSEVDPADVAVFILPGGDRWENAPIEVELRETLKSLDAKGVPLAAICGATLTISRLGLLRGRRHSPSTCRTSSRLKTTGNFFSRAGRTNRNVVQGSLSVCS